MPTASLPTADDVLAVLRGVIDPELGSDIVELGMAKGAKVQPDGNVVVTIALTTAGCPLRAQIQRDVRARVSSLPGVTHVQLDWTEMTQEEKSSAMAKARWNVAQRPEDTSLAPTTKVVLVASGKGGVGKSSVTVNLAAALAASGRTVGVLDADIWGFSVPRMLGVSGRLAGEERDGKKQMIPHERRVGDGVLRVISMGFLVEDEEQALMWRGLMLNRGVTHFLQDVAWGDDLDYLFIEEMEYVARLATGDWDAPEVTGPASGQGFFLFDRRLPLHLLQGNTEAAMKIVEDFRAGPMANDWSLMVVAAMLGDRERANHHAAKIDARPGSAIVLINGSYMCACGAPFDLSATPNLQARLAESGLTWSPAAAIRFPGKDW